MKEFLAKNKNFTIILTLFVIAGIVGWVLYFKRYAQADTISIYAFPKEIGAWKSEEMPIKDDEYAILETRNAFVRKYTNGAGQAVYLFLIYSQNNRKVSHPPEICYTGGGASILSDSKETIATIDPALSFDVNSLDLSLGPIKHLSLYWFKIGSAFTSNYWKQQILIALKTLLGA